MSTPSEPAKAVESASSALRGAWNNLRALPNAPSVGDAIRNLNADPVLRWLPAALGAVGGGGGAAYLASRETARPGETRTERARRILTNAAAGAGLGGLGLGGTFYGASLLANPGEDQGSIVNSLLSASNAEGSTRIGALLGGGAGSAIGARMGMTGWDKKLKQYTASEIANRLSALQASVADKGKMTADQTASFRLAQEQARKAGRLAAQAAAGNRGAATFKGAAGGGVTGSILGGLLSFAPEFFLN